ncbi:MAG: malto-oligosyltrehalose synthase [Nitrospiraceae bacterium]|nr:malto-oligosyltrehalose synthase [Nitrospiraceae bacterium]
MGNTEEAAGVPAIPASTYRLQFNRLLTFEMARRIVPYLQELGITCIYCSPYFKSLPGSLHGYDIIRYDELNPEVGTAEEYGQFTGELSRRGMQQILDIVPHHMCILGDNPWWQSVLENGQSSPYASFFDIDWSPPLEVLKGKVLLPILADQYGKVLESGEIRLDFKDGAFFIACNNNRLPVEPRSYELVLRRGVEELEKEIPESAEFQELMSIITALSHLPEAAETDPEKKRERNREKEIIKRRLAALHESSGHIRRFLQDNIRVFNGAKGDRRSFDPMDGLVSRQPYRLSFWMVATDEINYRRFFDINELAAIRVEQPEVFNESHRFVLELIRQGKVTGLRVDHLDGLYNPAEYLRTLQEKAFLARIPEDVPEAERQALAQSIEKGIMKTPPAIPFYIVGEKILQKGERIPEDWPIFGTTGYAFMNSLNGLFVRGDNEKIMDDIYFRFAGGKVNFSGLQYQAKKLILVSSMSAEVNILGHRLYMLAQKSRLTRDFTFPSLTKALSEVIACFPVYRTYISSSGVTDRDRRYIEQAVNRAKRLNPSVSNQIFQFIRQVLALEYAEGLSPEEKAGWFDFAMRFQQQTGPVMAKGIEDTAFYVYNRLLSLNEVGGSPGIFGTPVETFHGQNIERNKYWPFSLISTSTHDSKRSEDVRARINVLTEMPRAWRDAISRWKRANRKKKPSVEGKPVPDNNDEYHLYQVMVGVWPPTPPDNEGLADMRQRIKQYMLKAVREAKVNTSWISPNKEYEDALNTFIDRILGPAGHHGPADAFLGEFTAFSRTVAWYGMLNGLSQVLLKAASPGVPDFYQGTEFWTLSLVDPDNRREVDYGARSKLLEELKAREGSLGKVALCRELLANMQDSRVKLYVTWKALNFRKVFRDVFSAGQYIPLESGGQMRQHLCAFLRKDGGSVMVCAPRFFVGLGAPGNVPTGEAVWKDTFVALPAPMKFKDAFTDRVVAATEINGRHVIPLKDLFSDFPLFLANETA